MRNLISAATVVFLFCAPLSLVAGVLEQDFLASGDGLLTYDNVNQREWLDLTHTSGVSLASIQSQMGPGETFEGFEFAMLEDVEQLALSADVFPIDGFNLPGHSGPGPEELVELLDWIVLYKSSSYGDLKYTLGQLATGFNGDDPIFDDENVVVWYLDSEAIQSSSINVALSSSSSSSGGYFVSPPINMFGETIGSGDTGPFWLYRTAVPEPSSIFLLAAVTVAALFAVARQ